MSSKRFSVRLKRARETWSRSWTSLTVYCKPLRMLFLSVGCNLSSSTPSRLCVWIPCAGLKTQTHKVEHTRTHKEHLERTTQRTPREKHTKNSKGESGLRKNESTGSNRKSTRSVGRGAVLCFWRPISPKCHKVRTRRRRREGEDSKEGMIRRKAERQVHSNKEV